MNKNSTNQVGNLLFPELYPLTPSCGKNIEVSFTAPDLSSEGGLLLLREFDGRTGFIGRLNSCIGCLPNVFSRLPVAMKMLMTATCYAMTPS